jgi:16S rRNA (guanine527-N7)-methyltransferase
VTVQNESGFLRKALDQSKAFGFLGPGPVEVAIDHAEGFLAIGLGLNPRLDSGHWVDLGSGGGVPGLVGIDRLPHSTWTLVDAQTKRIRFLESVVAEWEQEDRVAILLGRAEEIARSPMGGEPVSADVVVARGFGPPALTAECAIGFLRVGGYLIVSEPPDSDGDRWARLGRTGLGLSFEGVQRSGAFGYAVIRHSARANPIYPRTGSVLVKKPLF